MSKPNTMKRIHDLFASGETPKTLTKDERKELQNEYEGFDMREFELGAEVKQSSKETEAQAFARFEKQMSAALKKAKEFVAGKTMKELEIYSTTFAGGKEQIRIEGRTWLSDAALIKSEHTTWKHLVKQQKAEAKARAESQDALGALKKQNEVLKDLVAALGAGGLITSSNMGKNKPIHSSKVKGGKSAKSKSKSSK